MIAALRRAVLLLTAGCGALLTIAALPAAASSTPAGTSITNTSTATYSDGTINYSSQSNTVTTTVQNVPALTISPASVSPGSNTVSPGGAMTDTYTLTNVGNGPGYFQLSGAQGTDDGVTSGTATFNAYVVTVAGQSAQTLTSIAAVNAYLATGNAGGPFLDASGAATTTVALNYTTGAGATGSVTSALTATITQPAGAGTVQATSALSVGNYTDTVTADARMDVQVSIVAPTSSTLATYTLAFNDGGGRSMVAVNRAGLPAGSGITGAGIVVANALPQIPSATSLTLNGPPTFTKQPAGATFIYSLDGTNWTTSSTGATYVGVFIPASAVGVSFGASNPGSAQNSVTFAQAQLSFTFQLNNSTASGAANLNAVTDVANSIYADGSGFIEGPGIAFQSVANTGSATAMQTAPALANTNGGLQGAGTASSSASAAATAVLNGPSGQPAATGSDGTTATDYTVISYTNGGTVSGAVDGTTVTVPAAAAPITFTNSVQNTGNKDDVITLTSTISNLPSGWTVAFENAGGATLTTLAVASGATAIYKVVFTPPASGATTFNAFTLYDDPIVATSGNDNTKSNSTHDEFVVGGFVRLVTSVAVASGQPCASASTFTTGALGAKPGDCVQYTIAFANVSPSGGTGNVSLNAVTLVLSADGTASGGTGATAFTNTWAANTAGLFGAPIDPIGTISGYSGGTPVGSTKFTDTIAALAAGVGGSVIFLVQVK